MKIKNRLLYFFAPVALFFVICVFLNVFPFGESSFLISDMFNQYIDYFGYFKSIISGENDIFYTFSKSMGGDMTGLISYYLMSPINIIFVFFSNENLVYAITIVIALKIGLCGLTCGLYLENICDNAKFVTIFATSYALMSYNIAYCYNVMWIDGVYMLPLIALSIDRLLQKKGFFAYILSLTYALAVNYYIGYMLCIFSVLYYLYKQATVWNRDWKNTVHNAVVFGFSSVMAGGLAAVLLVPTFKALSGTKAVFNKELFAWSSNFELTELLYKMFAGTINTAEVVDGLPNIYCGAAISALAIMFFVKKGISIREKLCSAAFAVVLVMSFYIRPLNLVWHGFNPPSWFPYRYSFIFSFWLIVLAFKAVNTETEKRKSIYALIAAIELAIGFNVFAKADMVEYLNKPEVIAETVALILIVVLCYICANYKRLLKCGTVLIVTIQILSLIINAVSLNEINLSNKNTNDYVASVKGIRSVTDWIKENDSSFYRMEKTFQRSQNDSMQFGYNGLSHFSSTEKTFVKNFIGDLGFRNNGNWVNYVRGSSVAAESFLGIKYVADKGELNKPYVLLNQIDDIKIYENPYSLPIGIVCDYNVGDMELQNVNLFARQNQIYSAITGKETTIWNKANIISVEYDNLDLYTEPERIYLQKQDVNKPGYIRYKVMAANSDEMYLYIDPGEERQATLYVNGVSHGEYLTVQQWDMYPIGKFSPGEIVDITLEIESGHLFVESENFWHEDIAALENCVNSIKNKCSYVTEKLSSSHIVSSGISEEKSVLLFTIPSEIEWKLKVDGENAEHITVFDALIGVELEPGAHTVELRFIPSGFKTGFAISIISVIICMLVFVVTRKNKYK